MPLTFGMFQHVEHPNGAKDAAAAPNAPQQALEGFVIATQQTEHSGILQKKSTTSMTNGINES